MSNQGVVRGGVWGLILAAAFLMGCHRGYYREQADAVATELIREKANNPHWALPRASIAVDPRSRMFDPFNPDYEPMPPDDPASHELMHWVDHKPGWPGWHRNGDTTNVQGPDWMASLLLDENGVLRLDADQAYQLALLHSPDYQQEFEDLYLSALDVSAERFRFDTQFFGGYSSFYTASGRLRSPRSELDLRLSTSQTGSLGLPAGGVSAPTAANLLLRKGFVTGADLAVGFANSLLWEFSGPDDHSAFTLLDFSLIQPLLRQAGRDRILEQLTIAERVLLANVRQMERFRRGFFVEIMTGTNAGQGATRRGGFFGGAGLEGFTGVGGGGFGQVGGGGFGGAGGGGFGGGGAGAAEVGGFLGLLQSLQDIRNQQVTIVGLRSNLAQLNESLQESLTRIPDDVETVIRERLQIAQARQALLNAESRLLNSQAAYQLRLDLFKADLGLPPFVCTYVRDSMIDQFNLIDPEVLEIQDRITQLRSAVAVVNDQLLAARSDGQVEIDQQLVENLDRLHQIVVQMEGMMNRIRGVALANTTANIQQLREAVPGRRAQLLSLQQKFQQASDRFQQYDNLDPCQMALLADIDPAVFDVGRLEAAPMLLEQEASRLEAQFVAFAAPLASARQYIERLLDGATRPPAVQYSELEQRAIFAVPSMLSDLSDDVLDLSLVQARARTDIVALTPIDLGWEAAFEMASAFRRDWMNQRAALVDSWRLIEFNADNLEGNLDIVMEGDLRNVGDNPVRLRDINGQIRMGLRFDAPLTRLQERNTYRQALIEFQQSRRQYYQFVDNVSTTLRNIVRTIDLNQVNFEERRIAVLSAIDQVVLNDQIQKLREQRGLEAGVTAARDVVSALADLQAAQNDFLSVWLNYESQRLSLDWNLGTMNLGPDGMWIDPGPIGPTYGYPQPFGFPAELVIDPAHEPHLLPYRDEEMELLPPVE